MSKSTFLGFANSLKSCHLLRRILFTMSCFLSRLYVNITLMSPSWYVCHDQHTHASFATCFWESYTLIRPDSANWASDTVTWQLRSQVLVFKAMGRTLLCWSLTPNPGWYHLCILSISHMKSAHFIIIIIIIVITDTIILLIGLS